MSSGPCAPCPVFRVTVQFHVQCSMSSVPVLQCPAFHVSSISRPVFQCSMSSAPVSGVPCPVLYVQCSMSSVPVFQCSMCSVFHVQCSIHILQLRVKSFIPAREDLFFILAESCFFEMTFSYVIVSARPSRIKK